MKYYLGTDIGGTNVKAALINEKNDILFFKSTPIKRSPASDSLGIPASKEDICAAAVSLISDMFLSLGISSNEISSAGIGICGIIEGIKGPVLYTPNAGLSGCDFINEIFTHLNGCGNPISQDIFYMTNDADCAGLAEAVLGAGKDFENIFLMTLGTGVGGSLICGKEPVSFGKYGGEFGHFHFSGDGPLCSCGIKGCFEQYANAAGFKRLGFEKYTDALAEGLAGFVNMFRPDLIVLAGGVTNEGEKLFDALNKKLALLVYAKEYINAPKIVCAKTSEKAGALGAALFGRISEEKL